MDKSEITLSKTRGPTPSSLKLKLTKETIINIDNLIPDSNEYTYVKSQFKRLLEKLHYTAPEVLGIIWTELHKLLQKYIPRIDDSPEWIEKINTVWGTSIECWAKLHEEFEQPDEPE